MKLTLTRALVATLLLSGSALADDGRDIGPVKLNATQLDNVTAGVGANNVAVQPWPALTEAGFSLNHNPSSDGGAAEAGSLDGVAVPSAVPHSS